jgi:hypothetical protein
MGCDFVDNSGFSSIGAVIGLTYPERNFDCERVDAKSTLLVSGLRAQAEREKIVDAVFGSHLRCRVFSRGIIASHGKKASMKDLQKKRCIVFLQ